MTFKDYFSGQSCDYSHYRPGYPQSLFAYLAAQLAQQARAWDCGTGNGQAALGLAAYFDEVIATDASKRQIANATAHPRVRYIIAPAEDSGLDSRSVDLVTVAQALHWFDLDRFYAEVCRVLRPGGGLAAWCYGLLQASPAVDAVLQRLYAGILGPYWPPERRWVEAGYRGLPFPFAQRQTPYFEMQAEWDLEHLIGYLNTWSAVQRYRHQQGGDPLQQIGDELLKAWGRPQQMRSLRWPIHLLFGLVEPA